MERMVASGKYFVTYSNTVKWNTLVRDFLIPAKNISVIRHAAKNLSEPFSVVHKKNTEADIVAICQELLSHALQRNSHSYHKNPKIKFFFYASQWRPNKNIFTLLRAYDFLLKKQYIDYKLILTSNEFVPALYPYLQENNLMYEVIFLPRLSVIEWAACYKLAVLVINPSLSEGGCPSTFDEALSTGTPIVSANIDVFMEEFQDYEKHHEMTFDPYDWRDMAYRIEWAVKNRKYLLKSQQHFYNQVRKKRQWGHVGHEYIQLLDHIAEQENKNVA